MFSKTNSPGGGPCAVIYKDYLWVLFVSARLLLSTPDVIIRVRPFVLLNLIRVGIQLLLLFCQAYFTSFFYFFRNKSCTVWRRAIKTLKQSKLRPVIKIYRVEKENAIRFSRSGWIMQNAKSRINRNEVMKINSEKC